MKELLRSVRALQLDEQRADVAAATLVLRSLHYNGKVADQAVDVTLGLDSRLMTAKPSEDVEVDVLELPPCVPLSGKFRATNTHPYRVAIKVTHKELVAKRMTGKKSRDRSRAGRKVGHVLRAP